MKPTKLSWGILATGKIAHTFAKALPESQTGVLAAVASRELSKAEAFAAAYSTADHPVKAHGSYEALLADLAVQAVYISTPHTQHAQWAIAAAKAGKHILCEKPVAMNHAEAAAIFEAAREHNVFAMEAFMYRCHPQTRRLVELVRQGTIGELKIIQAAFSFRTDQGSDSRLVNPILGGGGILDVGCYTVSIARLMAGVALGESFVEPVEMNGFGHLEEIATNRHMDAYAIANLKFPKDILAQISTGVRVTQQNCLRLYGTEGHLFVPIPFTPGKQPGDTQIHIHRPGQKEPEIIEVPSPVSVYALEADNVAEHLEALQSPAMSWDDSLGNMAALDRWRAAIGLTYAADTKVGCGC